MFKVDRELSLSACPGVVSRPPRTNKTANPRANACGGIVTGQIETAIKYEVILGLQPREKAAFLKVTTI